MSTNLSNDLLFHPHLLSNEQLLQILTMRCIKLENKKQIERSELLDLYRRVVLPLGQRASSSQHKPTSPKKSETPVTLTVSIEPSLSCVIPKRKLKINKQDDTGQAKRVKLEDESDWIKRKLEETVVSETPPKKIRQLIKWP